MNCNFNSPDSTEEFIQNPTVLSLKLVEKVDEITQKYNAKLSETNLLKKTSFHFKIILYQKHNHLEYNSYLQKYQLPNFDQESAKKQLQVLFNELFIIQDKLILHNIALALFFQTADIGKYKVPFTMDKKRNLMLKKLFQNLVTVDKFKSTFGHYALNPYDISSKRFSEYSKDEINKLASLAQNFSANNKDINMVHSNPKNEGEIFQNLIIIRDLAKFVGLKLIAKMRNIILEQPRSTKTKDLFSLSWDEMLSVVE